MQALTRAVGDAESRLWTVAANEQALRLARLWKSLTLPELRVVVFGEFNRGKSTLINALLGRLVLPAKLIPTTGHVTWVVYGEREEVRVQHLDGREETCGLDQLDSVVSLNGGGQAREGVEVIEVAVGSPLLEEGVVLVDTPGLNEQAAQTRRARDAVAWADLVLLVLDARQLLSLEERVLAVDWLGKGLGKAVAPAGHRAGSRRRWT